VPLLFTTTSNFQQDSEKDVQNCFEKYLKTWFVSTNDLLTFPIKFEYFPARVSPHIQPNSIQVCYDNCVWIIFWSILIIGQESLKD
jgi:hypothetical protein